MNKNRKTSDGDAVWGAEDIGAEVNLTAEQARYHLRKGTFGDAVQKVGHRTWVGSRSRLKQFPRINTADEQVA